MTNKSILEQLNKHWIAITIVPLIILGIAIFSINFNQYKNRYYPSSYITQSNYAAASFGPSNTLMNKGISFKTDFLLREIKRDNHENKRARISKKAVKKDYQNANMYDDIYSKDRSKLRHAHEKAHRRNLKEGIYRAHKMMVKNAAKIYIVNLTKAHRNVLYAKYKISNVKIALQRKHVKEARTGLNNANSSSAMNTAKLAVKHSHVLLKQAEQRNKNIIHRYHHLYGNQGPLENHQHTTRIKYSHKLLKRSHFHLANARRVVDHYHHVEDCVRQIKSCQASKRNAHEDVVTASDFNKKEIARKKFKNAKKRLISIEHTFKNVNSQI